MMRDAHMISIAKMQISIPFFLIFSIIAVVNGPHELHTLNLIYFPDWIWYARFVFGPPSFLGPVDI